MDISIIILTKNAGESFTTLLQRLSSQKLAGNYEIIVLDSGSTDSTLEIARSFPTRITRIKPEEFHHGRTRNLGAELASGNILVYITQDALPLHDSWLHKLTQDVNQPRVAMVIGRQIPWPDTKPPEKFFYSYYFPEHKIEVVRDAPDYYRDNMFISNVNSAISREAWKKLRFSGSIALAEDKEFAKRALLDGWKIVYQPEATVYHAHDFTLRSLYERAVLSGIALSQGAGVPRSRHRIRNRILYHTKEAIHICRNDIWWKWLPYSLIYNFIRTIGTAIGWLKWEITGKRIAKNRKPQPKRP